jgi:hypothetical protein
MNDGANNLKVRINSDEKQLVIDIVQDVDYVDPIATMQ